MAETFDLAHFKTMTGGDAALQAEVAGLFRGQAAHLSAQLDADAPRQLWRDAAHTLKGSARGIGLWRLAQACEQAEAAAEADAATALGAVRAALGEALAALDTLAA